MVAKHNSTKISPELIYRGVSRVFYASVAAVDISKITIVWRACNLTAFTPCLTGPVDYPFASHHKGPRFKNP